MAIGEDTAALVAAQLTVAWSNLYATKEGVGGLPEAELPGRITAIYDQFRSAVAETDRPAKRFDMRKLLD